MPEPPQEPATPPSDDANVQGGESQQPPPQAGRWAQRARKAPASGGTAAGNRIGRSNLPEQGQDTQAEESAQMALRFLSTRDPIEEVLERAKAPARLATVGMSDAERAVFADEVLEEVRRLQEPPPATKRESPETGAERSPAQQVAGRLMALEGRGIKIDEAYLTRFLSAGELGQGGIESDGH